MKKSIRKFFAALLSALLAVSLFPAVEKASEVSPDLSGMTTFTFSDGTVTVSEGSDTNYEVVVYTAEDEEKEAVSTENADSSSVCYSVPEDADGEIQVAIKKKGGSYVFEGEGTGSIAVKKEATSASCLYLNGLTLASSITAPITVKKDSSATCTIYAVENTTNTLTDAETNNADNYTENKSAESAVIKGKASAEIILSGGGTLNLECYSKNAVKVGDNGALTIENLALNVTSAGHGISSDNALTINSGTITIHAESDGIRSDPDTLGTTGDGCITVNGGSITAVTGSDGIQAAQDLTITGGTFNITAAGGCDAVYDKDSDSSAKGLKASGSDDDAEDATNTVTITGGTFTLNTADDAVHSDGYIVITGGDFSIQTGDDGIHADTSLTFGEENGSNEKVNVAVAKSYEGLEAGNVYIYSGTFQIISSDDGINAAGGSDSDASGTTNDHFNPGGGPGSPNNSKWSIPGSSGSSSTEDYSLNIYGGELLINADGDGLDSNGSMTLGGGNLVVWGEKSGSDDAPMDSEGNITIKGATVFAAGSSAMKELPSSASSQPYLSSTTSAAAGKTINIKYNDTTKFNILAAKNVNFILYSSPDMSSSSGWSIVVNSDALLEAEEDGGSCETTGHTWDSGVATTAATCTEEGERTYTCTVCGETKTEAIAATGHSYTDGYCTICGAEDPNASSSQQSDASDDSDVNGTVANGTKEESGSGEDADSSPQDGTPDNDSSSSQQNASSENSVTRQDSTSSFLEALDLKATAKTYKKICLSWNRISSVSKYYIYRAKNTENGSYSLIKKVTGDAVSYTDKTVETGTEYYYKVSVVLTDGSIATSSAVSAKAVLSKAKLEKAVQNKDGTVKLQWKKVKGAEGYVIYASGDKKAAYKKIKTVKKASRVSYTLKKSIGRKYRCYKIRAYRVVNGKRVYSAYSDIVKVLSR